MVEPVAAAAAVVLALARAHLHQVAQAQEQEQEAPARPWDLVMRPSRFRRRKPKSRVTIWLHRRIDADFGSHLWAGPWVYESNVFPAYQCGQSSSGYATNLGIACCRRHPYQASCSALHHDLAAVVSAIHGR